MRKCCPCRGKDSDVYYFTTPARLIYIGEVGRGQQSEECSEVRGDSEPKTAKCGHCGRRLPLTVWRGGLPPLVDAE